MKYTLIIAEIGILRKIENFTEYISAEITEKLRGVLSDRKA